jgi:hypothetical protein
MLELIKYDVVNGSKTSHKDVAEIIFNDYKEMEEFRKKIVIEHPDADVYLTYKHIDNITKKLIENGETKT